MSQSLPSTGRQDLLGRAWRVWLCSRPFWVYLPIVTFLLAWAGGQAGGLRATGLFLAGLFAWTLVEWGLHALMHVRTRWEPFRRFQEFAHLGHHHHPDHLPGTIVTLRGSLPLAALFFGICLLLLRSLVPASLLFSGLLAGYVFYEFVHLATHARWRIPLLTWLERYHGLHHSRGWNRTFGVTCPLWDYVFGTGPR